MRILGKEFRELERTDPQRIFERHLRAEAVAAEPAEAAAVITLAESGALLEEIADRVERKQDRDQQHRARARQTGQQNDARTLAPVYHHHQRDHDYRRQRQRSPCRAGKAQKDRDADEEKGQRASQRLAEAFRQHALQRHERRQQQKRAQHVRVLERAARAAIERQQVMAARHEAEISGHGGGGGDDRADHIAAQQIVDPVCGVFGENHREEDRRDRQIPGCRDPGRDFVLEDRDGADRVAEVEQQQQHDRHQKDRPQLEAGREKHDQRRQRRKFVGTGLDKDDRAARSHQPQHGVLQRRDARRHRPRRQRDLGGEMRHVPLHISRRSGCSEARTVSWQGCRRRTAATSSRCNTGRTRRASGSSRRCRLRRASR